MHILVFAGLLLMALSPSGFAGATPWNTLVVVNDASIESQELGNYYASARGIPARNICHLDMPEEQFRDVLLSIANTAIVDRINAHIAEEGLSNQIDVLVLCKEIPYRIKRYNTTGIKDSTTSYLYYGWKTYDPYGAAGPCVLPDDTTNFYFASERALYRRDDYGGTNYMLTMMLHGFTLSQAKGLVDKGTSADYTYPTNPVFLLKTTDYNRNVRYRFFDNLDFDARSSGLDLPREFLEVANSIPTAETNVFGYQTARVFVTDIKQHIYPAGTIADHLTSCGGYLLDAESCGGGAQMSILSWISNGVSASYGTIIEPCNFTQKFPDPRVYYWQRRGFNNGESYYMSVQNPFQGIFVGDPLAAPFARPPSVLITNLTDGQAVTGSVSVYATASTNESGIPSQSIELYVDGVFRSNMATGAPLAGNKLTITVDGSSASYTVSAGDTLYDAVEGLANVVNIRPWDVDAVARGDRLSLTYNNYGQVGTGVSYSITTETGTASRLAIWGSVAFSNLTEAIYPAREFLSLGGFADTGDTVACVITLTNGTATTNIIVAGQGETSGSVLSRLRNAINADPLLTNYNGTIATNYLGYYGGAQMSLDARSGGAWGYNLSVDYQVAGTGLDSGRSFTDNFNDNLDVLTAHGDIYFTCGETPLEGSYTLDTTSLPNGPCTLTAVARLGDGTEAAAWTSVTVIVSNSAMYGELVAPTNGHVAELGNEIVISAAWHNVSGAITQTAWTVQGRTKTYEGSTNQYAFDTLDAGVGEVEIYAVAWDSAGPSARTPSSDIVITMSDTIDTDGDGLADAWEQYWFGTIWLFSGTNNPDGDDFNNYGEYMADTDPTSSTSYFSIATISVPDTTTLDVVIYFESSSNRVYQTEFTDGFATNTVDWSTGSAFFAGSGFMTNWVDDGSGTSSHPTNVEMRTYRMRVKRP